MKVMPPPGQTIDRRAASRHRGQRLPHRARQPHRILGDAGAQRAAGAAMNSTVHSAGSQFSRCARPTRAGFGQFRLDRAQLFVEPIEGVLLAGRRDHQHRQAGPGDASDRSRRRSPADR
jgi:hypothetical protein